MPMRVPVAGVIVQNSTNVSTTFDGGDVIIFVAVFPMTKVSGITLVTASHDSDTRTDIWSM
jgi:hypothetical protein